jgi:hypothetical protein
MALPLSGQISMNDIRIELGIPTQTPFSLSDAVNGVYVVINTCSPFYPSTTPPYNLSNWYGYDHSYVCCYSVAGNWYRSTLSSANACTLPGTVQNLYNSTGTTPVLNEYVYRNTSCTIPAFPGWYSDGSNWFYIEGTDPGLVTDEGLC